MDLSKMPNDKKLDLCKWYFKVGFLFLPFIWAVNCIWFFNEAFRKPEYEQQSQIKRYVIFSTIGTLVWAVVIIAWVATFQTYRVEWGKLGDDLSFIIPLGE